MSVYFAQIGHDGPIKIGTSKNVASRMRSLQVGVPWPLKLLLVIENETDSAVYHHFSSSRMRGEWFYPTRELLEFITRQHKLSTRSGASWVRARRRAGTNLTFLRRVTDLCEQIAPTDQERCA